MLGKSRGSVVQTKPRPCESKSIVSSRLRQEAAEMESCDDSAFCRYHRGRRASLGGVEWEFSAVGVESQREKELCNESCAAYGGGVLGEKAKNAERKDVDRKRSYENWEPEMKVLNLKARKSLPGKENSRKTDKMAAGEEYKNKMEESELPGAAGGEI